MMKNKKLMKSKDKVLSGVLGGVAEYLDLDKALVRIIGAILIIFPGQLIIGIVIYIIAAVVMPEDDGSNHSDDNVVEGEFRDK
ncbi:PspC domain-containing protein [Liquorilactobacillus mali]|uniref:Stress-responsive transcriptional regulator PspC n=3 Tax=Liquorilactobacillus mali TaxID=1618 RepID=A0A0R2E561_9LACO|nr:PspC domain-containing protein [Liquorilactobacillus mali]KRN11599.1 stress-responsive transcriptional regulator PspC [Liquorilactobacillus mali KCTC 3596 = DSM 20444]KRN31606.1 stress-responsive transcriptional regulator PspC [Liquorilactobacillus mali]MDN7145181.1 PspC domain-containing protein [Liquorilactobacillus mali]